MQLTDLAAFFVLFKENAFFKPAIAVK